MVRQNLQKPNLQRTRLVVRITGKYVVAQLIKAYPNGDKTIAHVNSKELRAYNVTMGLKNYSACYMTGLLLGKRAMRQCHLSKIYRGNTDVGKSHLVTNLVGQPASVSAILDIGLKRPTPGAKVFAVLKGVADAGVNIPHDPKKFFGYDAKKKELNSEKLKDRIMGITLAKYAAEQVKNSATQHFSQFNNAATGMTPEMYPALVAQAIKAIHKDPKKRTLPKLASKKPVKRVTKQKRKTKAERDADVSMQKQAWMSELGAVAAA